MSYWTDRQRQLNTALEKDEEKLKARLSRLYDTEAARLDKEIAAYFAKYGEDNVLEYRRLLEELPDEDKVLLIERMNEFAAKYPEYSHLMPVRESVYKLDRLQGLQASVQMQQLELAGKEQEMISEHLEKAGQRAFKAAAETMGFGSSFYAMNKDIAKTFVDVPWSNGMKFSDSIWSNKQKLYGYLNRELAQSLARGDSYERITKHMTDRFKSVSKRDAYRLIYTEGTFVQAEASIQPFTEDFDKYRISTVGDAKVCDICKGISEEVFGIKDRKAGENFPPFHPWCRCTFTIEIEDRSAWVDQYVAKHGGDQAEAGKIEKRFDSSEDDGTIRLRLNYFNKDDILYIESFSIEEEPGFEDVCGHGNEKQFEIRSKPMTAAAFADYIKESGEFHGQNLRFVSCSVGSGENSFAQQLSKILGIRVKAPNMDAYYDTKDGVIFIGSPHANVGKWRVFENGEEIL